MFKKSILIICLCAGFSSFSQSLEKIDNAGKAYQECLDSGTDMAGCSASYFKQLDEMEKAVYKEVMDKISPEEKSKLKAEEKEWAKKKDAYFKKASAEAKQEAGGTENQDFKMIFSDKKAEYVKERVTSLMNTYKV